MNAWMDTYIMCNHKFQLSLLTLVSVIMLLITLASLQWYFQQSWMTIYLSGTLVAVTSQQQAMQNCSKMPNRNRWPPVTQRNKVMLGIKRALDSEIETRRQRAKGDLSPGKVEQPLSFHCRPRLISVLALSAPRLRWEKVCVGGGAVCVCVCAVINLSQG